MIYKRLKLIYPFSDSGIIFALLKVPDWNADFFYKERYFMIINKNDTESKKFKKELNNLNLQLNTLLYFPKLEKSLLELFIRQNKDFYEIAKILNITKAQVRQLKQVILERVKNNKMGEGLCVHI